ncbi:hypothetical protein V1511DRAFT_155702 [Dipodascopsis uninucleata]
MSKRRPDTQLTRDDLEAFGDDYDRHGPPDPSIEASAQVMSKRKIAQPRSRKVLNGAGSIAPSPSTNGESNPFANIGSSASKPNPFGSLVQSSSSATPVGGPDSKLQFSSGLSSTSNASKPFSFGVISTPSLSNASKADSEEGEMVYAGLSPEFTKFLKIRALNEKFGGAVTDGLNKDKLADLVETCKTYIKYFEQIESEHSKVNADAEESSENISTTPASSSFSATPSSRPLPSTIASSALPSTVSFNFGKTALSTSSSSISPGFGSKFTTTEESTRLSDLPTTTTNVGSSLSTQSTAFSSSTPFNFNKPAETIHEKATAKAKATEKTTVNEDSESSSDSDSDSPKIEGPTFNITSNLMKSKDSPFSFSSSNKGNGPNLDGPAFKLSDSAAKITKSPFKFTGPSTASSSAYASDAKDSSSTEKSNELSSEKRPAENKSPFSFGSATAETSISAAKPQFSFGSSGNSTAFSSKPATTTPSFSFGTINPQKMGSTEKESKAPIFGASSVFGSSNSSFGKEDKKSDANDGQKAKTPPPTSILGSNTGSDATGSPLKITSLGSNNSSSAPSTFKLSFSKPGESGPTAVTDSFKFNIPATSSSAASDPSKSTDTLSDKPSFSFGLPSSTSSTTSSPSNNLWTPDKGVKFGQSDTSKSISSNEGTPSKSVEFKNPLTSTFGSSSTSGAVPSFAFKPSVGFSFGSNPSQITPSSSISESSAESAKPVESANTEEGEDGDAAPKEAQINLAEKGPGEEDEDVAMEGRTRVYQYKSAEENKGTAGFVSIGVGPYRILTHSKTKKSRILVRADGSGRILINIALRPNVEYKTGPGGQVRVVDALADGKFVSYLLKLKTVDDAEKLKNILEEKKNE